MPSPRGDLTGQRMTTDDQLVDNRELRRRIRRVLAAFRSIAVHMNVGTQDARESALHLAGRVGAIGRAAQAPVSAGMDLESLVLDELLAIGARRYPVMVGGPPVRLNAKAAELMSLAIHELATNAVKYGALSQSQARLRVTWWIADQPNPWLHFAWTESGVRMAAGAGRKPGFGYELVSRLVGSELHGNGEILFLDGGVLCSIGIPLNEVLHPHER